MKELVVNKTNTHLKRTKLSLIQYRYLLKKPLCELNFYKLDKKESNYWFLTKSYQVSTRVGSHLLLPGRKGPWVLTGMLPSPKRLTAHGGGIF